MRILFQQALVAAILIAVASRLAGADDIMSYPYVYSWQGYYAKSYTCGRTEVYKMGCQTDSLMYTFKWYSEQVRLFTARDGFSVIAITRVHGGRTARKDQVALRFCLNGRELSVYSPADLVDDSDCVRPILNSYYSVLDGIISFGLVDHHQVLRVLLCDDTEIQFSLDDGKVLHRGRTTISKKMRDVLRADYPEGGCRCR